MGVDETNGLRAARVHLAEPCDRVARRRSRRNAPWSLAWVRPGTADSCAAPGYAQRQIRAFALHAA